MPLVAVSLQALLLAYHQVTTRVDFFPFNGARYYSRRETQLEAGTNLVLMSLPLLGFVFQWPPLMKFGVEYYFILLAIECATWWAPYWLGPSPAALATYHRIHRQTITVVPRRGTNPAPNLEHLILMALTALTAVATLRAWRATTIAFPSWWVGVLLGGILVGGTVYQFCLHGRIPPHSS